MVMLLEYMKARRVLIQCDRVPAMGRVSMRADLDRPARS